MGQACVFLNVTTSTQKISTRTLIYPDFEHGVRAFWKGSPSYCLICHEDT